MKKYVIRKGNRKKHKTIVSKKNASIKRNRICGDKYGVKGICIGMLSKPHQIQLKLIKKTKNRKYLQLMVNILKKGYGWWAATQMARYFTAAERRKKVSPLFNSKGPYGLTSIDELKGPKARIVEMSKLKVNKKRRIRAVKNKLHQDHWR